MSIVPNPQDRSERSNPEENQTPHSQRTERGSERGEGELEELERGTGGQGWVWRLSERGLVEWREKRGEGDY